MPLPFSISVSYNLCPNKLWIEIEIGPAILSKLKETLSPVGLG
jgi:hypothetical protein